MEQGQAQPHIKRQEPRHEHPKPNQEHLGQRKERLGQSEERLAQGGERLKGERLEGSLMEEMDKVLLRGVVTLKVHEECGNGEVRPAPLKVVK